MRKIAQRLQQTNHVSSESSPSSGGYISAEDNPELNLGSIVLTPGVLGGGNNIAAPASPIPAGSGSHSDPKIPHFPLHQPPPPHQSPDSNVDQPAGHSKKSISSFSKSRLSMPLSAYKGKASASLHSRVTRPHSVAKKGVSQKSRIPVSVSSKAKTVAPSPSHKISGSKPQIIIGNPLALISDQIKSSGIPPHTPTVRPVDALSPPVHPQPTSKSSHSHNSSLPPSQAALSKRGHLTKK